MPKKEAKKTKGYFVYILRCGDGTLYTGITTDVARRIEEHNSSPLGARYTKARRPVALAAVSAWPTRAAACREEVRIKKLPRAQKLALTGEVATLRQAKQSKQASPQRFAKQFGQGMY